MNKNILRVILIALIGLLSGCASKPSTNPDDPWESWNRKVYRFNKGVDDAIAKPVTTGYKAVTPDFVEEGISNVFANVADVPTLFNNLFQGKILNALSDLGRVTVNTTLGIGGLFDPASRMGLDKHDEDFGQTLGMWGVGSGPYVMLPFLGPKTLRDTAALRIDSELDPLGEIDHIPTRNQSKVLQLIDQRSALIKYEDLLKDVYDEYAYIRDAYLQNRRYKVLDGNIPFDENCEEDEDDCEF